MAEPTLIERAKQAFDAVRKQLGQAGGTGIAGEANAQVERNVVGPWLDIAQDEVLAALERHSLPGGAEAVRDVPPHGWVIKTVHAVFVDDTFTNDKRVRDAAIARGCYVTPVWASSLSAAKAALAASPPPSVWMGIDTAPKDDELFLVYAPPDAEFPAGRQMIVRGSILITMMSSGTPNHLQFPATHWAPLLPPPPQQEGK